MRTMIVAVMALGLGLNCWSANAQEDSRRVLAEDLLNEMNMKETVEKSFEMVKKMMPAQMAQMAKTKQSMEETDTPSSAAKPTDKAMTKMMDKMMDTVAQELSWETMKEDYITAYAETFTEEELQGAIAFYKSPAGKAFTKKQPALMEQTMKLSQKRMMQIMPKIQAMSKDMTKELMKEAAPQLKKRVPLQPPVPAQPPAAPQPEEPQKKGE